MVRKRKPPTQLSIKRLLNTSFSDIYKRLVLNDELSPDERIKVLSVAIILVNQDDINLKRLGYRIILFYANQFKDYVPLYDIAIHTGLIPVANLIKTVARETDVRIASSEFVRALSESFMESFRKEDAVFTEQQFVLDRTFQDHMDKSIYVVAPTSYGKSELIVSAVRENPDKKTCIIVPSKSLLAQTKKRVLDARISWLEKIVTHPEMHDAQQNFSVYILTQERLSRLLNIDRCLKFDVVFVDEAHNLLDKDNRSELLASVISVLYHRNPSIAIKHLTPFLNDVSNLKIRTSGSVGLSYQINEYIKSERYYIADFRSDKADLCLYDQFINAYYELDQKFGSHVEYVFGWSLGKNIIYFNKPKDIETFVSSLVEQLPLIKSPDIELAIQELSEHLDPDYLLIECLKRGVAYHHGSITDTVRHYVEHLFRKVPELKYLVSSSTLLEGVNLPIERLFLMNYRKGNGNLTASQFKNLVGRVNRFSELFGSASSSSLTKLEPGVHIVASDEYASSNANPRKFIRECVNVSLQIKDDPKNVLLDATAISEDNQERYEDAIARLENLENGIIPDYNRGYVTTTVGQLLIASGINEIDVFAWESDIENAIESVKSEKINDANRLVEVIFKTFIQFVEADEGNIKRLQNEEAQSFYSMLIDWRIKKTPFKMMIRRIIDYWDGLSASMFDVKVYVGKWGDETLDDGYATSYTTIGKKGRKEKVNLAIVRIKEEEDFLELFLFRFMEILYDLDVVEDEFYKKVKYGTTDETTICLIRHGLSRGVAELILKKYTEYVVVEVETNVVKLLPGLADEMKGNGESVLQVFEIEMNSGIQRSVC